MLLQVIVLVASMVPAGAMPADPAIGLQDVEAELRDAEKMLKQEAELLDTCLKSFEEIKKRKPAADAPLAEWQKYQKSLELWATACAIARIPPWPAMAKLFDELKKKLPPVPGGAGPDHPIRRMHDRVGECVTVVKDKGALNLRLVSTYSNLASEVRLQISR